MDVKLDLTHLGEDDFPPFLALLTTQWMPITLIVDALPEVDLDGGVAGRILDLPGHGKTVFRLASVTPSTVETILLQATIGTINQSHSVEVYFGRCEPPLFFEAFWPTVVHELGHYQATRNRPAFVWQDSSAENGLYTFGDVNSRIGLRRVMEAYFDRVQIRYIYPFANTAEARQAILRDLMDQPLLDGADVRDLEQHIRRLAVTAVDPDDYQAWQYGAARNLFTCNTARYIQRSAVVLAWPRRLQHTPDDLDAAGVLMPPAIANIAGTYELLHRIMVYQPQRDGGYHRIHEREMQCLAGLVRRIPGATIESLLVSLLLAVASVAPVSDARCTRACPATSRCTAEQQSRACIELHAQAELCVALLRNRLDVNPAVCARMARALCTNLGGRLCQQLSQVARTEEGGQVLQPLVFCNEFYSSIERSRTTATTVANRFYALLLQPRITCPMSVRAIVGEKTVLRHNTRFFFTYFPEGMKRITMLALCMRKGIERIAGSTNLDVKENVLQYYASMFGDGAVEGLQRTSDDEEEGSVNESTEDEDEDDQMVP